MNNEISVNLLKTNNFFEVIYVVGVISSQPRKHYPNTTMKLMMLLGLLGYFSAGAAGNPSPLENMRLQMRHVGNHHSSAQKAGKQY